jgi:hypothetical protein
MSNFGIFSHTPFTHFFKFFLKCHYAIQFYDWDLNDHELPQKALVLELLYCTKNNACTLNHQVLPWILNFNNLDRSGLNQLFNFGISLKTFLLLMGLGFRCFCSSQHTIPFIQPNPLRPSFQIQNPISSL